MNFTQAMNVVSSGKGVKRDRWKYNERGVTLQESTGVVFDGLGWRETKFLCMADQHGNFNIPYGLSEEDMIAEDWEVSLDLNL